MKTVRRFHTRVIQPNFSCTTCHAKNVGARLRSELLSPVIGQAVHRFVFRAGDNLVTL